MVDTGFSTFSTTVDKTNSILHEIELVHGWSKQRRSQSYAALRAVLHTLRDRLTILEAVQLAAPLPLLVRGVYYEGWEPRRAPQKMDTEQFLWHVRERFPYEVVGGVESVVRSVLLALHRYISDSEWRKVLAGVPGDLRLLLADRAPV